MKSDNLLDAHTYFSRTLSTQDEFDLRMFCKIINANAEETANCLAAWKNLDNAKRQFTNVIQDTFRIYSAKREPTA